MKNSSSRSIGKHGEDIAAAFLESKKYEIISRNYRWARGEIDIIARKPDLLVFVEVKTAKNRNFGAPQTWVTPQKQRQVGMVARHFLQQHDLQEVDCRFDVIAIEAAVDDWKINHIENAFWLEE